MKRFDDSSPKISKMSQLQVRKNKGKKNTKEKF